MKKNISDGRNTDSPPHPHKPQPVANIFDAMEIINCLHLLCAKIYSPEGGNVEKEPACDMSPNNSAR